MHGNSSAARFWLRWIGANGVAELVGLGTVAAVGYLIVRRWGEPSGLAASLAFAAVFVALGAFEGFVVGVAQLRVLRERLPEVRGWIGATVAGAVLSWVLGMTPSTVMSVVGHSPGGQPPEIGEFLRLLLAAGLGAVAGPLLALFQWRRLRACRVPRAGWWLAANAAAWAVGMPIVFAGAHAGAVTSDPATIAAGVALALLAAGAAVGAIHGRVLIRLLPLSSLAQVGDSQLHQSISPRPLAGEGEVARESVGGRSHDAR